MVGWLNPAAVASRIGGQAFRSVPWRQAPYLGALAAIAVFVSWKLTHNRDSNEAEEKPEISSTEDSEVRDADEKLDYALQLGVSAQELERSTETILNPGDLPHNDESLVEEDRASTIAFPESDGVPNTIISGHQRNIHPPDVQHGAGKADEGVDDNFKYVTEDLGSDKRKSENHLVDTSILSIEAEPLGAVVSSYDTLMPNSEELDCYEVGGNVQSTQVVQDVKGLREDPEISDTQVDKNVDTMNESAADAKNVKLEDIPMFSFKISKSNWLFPKIDSNSLAGQKRKAPERATGPNTDEEKNFEDKIIQPHEVYKSTEDGESRSPHGVSAANQAVPGDFPLSSPASQDGKPVVVDNCTESMDQSSPRANALLR